MAEDLKKQNYSAAIFLKPESYTAWAAWKARIPHRIGTMRRRHFLLYSIRLNQRRKYSGRHETDLNLDMLKPFHLPPPPANLHPVLSRPPGEMTEPELNIKNPYALIHLGSMGSAANWPSTQYLALARLLVRQMPVVLTGKDRIPENLPSETINLTQKTSFDELLRILSHAAVCVSGSTGPLHAAAAFGVPVVGLYPNHVYLGPHRWGPRSNKAIVLKPQNGCTQCVLRQDGSCTCMDSISVNDVLNAVQHFTKC